MRYIHRRFGHICASASATLNFLEYNYVENIEKIKISLLQYSEKKAMTAQPNSVIKTRLETSFADVLDERRDAAVFAEECPPPRKFNII
jgi:hypothetical protein